MTTLYSNVGPLKPTVLYRLSNTSQTPDLQVSKYQQMRSMKFLTKKDLVALTDYLQKLDYAVINTLF